MIRRHPLLWCGGGLVVLTGLLSGCNSTPPVAETPPPPVSVSQPLTREVIDHDDYEGRIAAVETIDVRARVRGYLVKVAFEDGELVKEGDLLFNIDPRPYQASLDAAAAQKSAAEAALELARKEYARTARLVSQNAASREEMDVWTAKQAVATADRLKALAAVEQAQLDLDFTRIRVPKFGDSPALRASTMGLLGSPGGPGPLLAASALFAAGDIYGIGITTGTGKAGRTQVTVGNLVNAGGGDTLLTTITSLDPMYVYFDVPERALLGYRQHFRKKLTERGDEPSVKDLQIPVKVGLEGEAGYPHEGVIDFVDNRVNSSTGTIQVRGVLPNAKRILDAGMRARVTVPVSDPRKALLVTERAVGTDQGIRFVYVVNDKNVVERRDVKLGRLSEGLQVVPEGVKPEDWVIVNGIQRVRDGATVEPKRVLMPGAPAKPANQESKS